MAEFTKERIEQFIKSPLEHGLTRSEQMEMARQLLASMEQEPVAWRWFHLKQWHVTNDEARARNLAWDGVNVTPLYAAPQLPQPAVQNMHHDAKCDLFRPQVVNGVFVPRHCDCSAATLQGAEPVSQPCTLRDGWVAVPVEPTEDMVIAGFEAELREEFRDPEAWEAFEAMSGCEQAATRAKWCWAAMISAAPQQEASNRIHEERVKIQEEMAMGARLTKHRFKVK